MVVNFEVDVLVENETANDAGVETDGIGTLIGQEIAENPEKSKIQPRTDGSEDCIKDEIPEPLI